MRTIVATFFTLLIVSSTLYSQSLYLEKKRVAIGVSTSVSAGDNFFSSSIGPLFSINKKVDFSIQYSSITLNVEDGYSNNADGISGSVNIWGKKAKEDSPLELALTIGISYSEYEDFSNTSYGGGLIAAYKKVQPHSFNFIPLVGVLYVPLNQTSTDIYYPSVLNNQFFSIQIGLGIFKDLSERSKFVIEPIFSLDNHYNLAGNLSLMLIL